MPGLAIKLREAKNSELLPPRLEGMWLVGVHGGTIYLASKIKEQEFQLFEDIFIYGFSVGDNRIVGGIEIKKGSWPESWAQKDDMLYIGTRSGHVVAVDLKTGKQIRQLKYRNGIDSIAVNNNVYFGVNGDGIHRASRRLASKGHYVKGEEWKSKIDGKDCDRSSIPVTSAMTFFNGSLYAFCFSNGRDPFLGESPCGGLVEILDKDLQPLSERKLSPAAVCHAVSDEAGVYFATRDTRNGNFRFGEGEFYLLNPKTLEYKEIIRGLVAVSSLTNNPNQFILGFQNGTVIGVDRRGHSETLYQSSLIDQTPTNGAAVIDGKVYIARPGKLVQVS